MRQVHVNLKPKPTHSKENEEPMQMKKLMGSHRPVPYEIEAIKSAMSSSASTRGDTKQSTTEEITFGYDLHGRNRVNELIALSQEISHKIKGTIDKCERVDERAHMLLGSEMVQSYKENM